jgi:2'-5' RNA ligase
MRTFVALNLPKKDRDRIHRAARPLREEGIPVRWVDAEAYHVTLKFLGEVRPERLPAIEEALERVGRSTAPFTLGFGGFGAFPTVRRPRVIWLGVDATPEVRCLKQDLEWALSECGFDTETRAFHPHLTLGRADPADGAGAFRGLDEKVAALEFTTAVPIRSVELMRSHLSREGAHYSVVASARLTGGG